MSTTVPDGQGAEGPSSPVRGAGSPAMAKRAVSREGDIKTPGPSLKLQLLVACNPGIRPIEASICSRGRARRASLSPCVLCSASSFIVWQDL